MLAGILNRLFIITSILVSTTIAVNAQFAYRVELLAGKSFFTQTDKISTSLESIQFEEQIAREGKGTIIGLKYNLKNYPVSLFLGYEKNKLSNYSLKSNIIISDQSQELRIESVDLDIQYLFFYRSTFKPYVFAGLSYNTLDYSRDYPSYRYQGAIVPGYIKVDEISWKYELIHTDLKAPGLNVGAGLNIRVSDKIGIFGNMKVRYIPQNQTDWLDSHIVLKTYAMGVYYRLLQRKNNIVL